jgi:hypothetical protein
MPVECPVLVMRIPMFLLLPSSIGINYWYYYLVPYFLCQVQPRMSCIDELQHIIHRLYGIWYIAALIFKTTYKVPCN